MAQSRGLGRGLSALIPGTTDRTVTDALEKRVVEIPVDKLIPNKNQPRHNFNDISLKELSDSIREFGIIQPIVVRSTDKGGHFEIISGERRLRAAKLLSLSKVPCIINTEIDDMSSLEMALIENIQRDDLTPIELSHTFKNLINEYKYTHEALSKKIGKSRVAITNSLRLLLLPIEIQKLVDEKHLSAGHARTLISLEDRTLQLKVAEQIIEKDLNVRDTEKLVSKTIRNKEQPEKGINKPVISLDKIPVVEKKVSDYLESPVNIIVGKNKGKIEILFGSIKDFERIVSRIIGKD